MSQYTFESYGITTTVIVTTAGRIVISQDSGEKTGDDTEVDVVVFWSKESVEWLRDLLTPPMLNAVKTDSVSELKQLRDHGNPIPDRTVLARFAGVTDAYTAGWQEGINRALIVLGLDR